MQITIGTQPFAATETEALVTYLFENGDPVQGRISEIDQSTNGLLKRLAKSGELTGKTLEMTLIHAPAGLQAARLLLERLSPPGATPIRVTLPPELMVRLSTAPPRKA